MKIFGGEKETSTTSQIESHTNHYSTTNKQSIDNFTTDRHLKLNIWRNIVQVVITIIE